MKNILLLSIFLIILTSLCAYLPQVELPEWPSSQQVQQAGILLTLDEKSPDIFLNVETSSSEIRAGRSIQISFELRNKQSYDLRNVELEVYDHPCFKDEDNVGLFFKYFDIIKANQSKMWSWKWKSDSNIDLQRSCPIRFKLSYDADYYLYQDVAVLPENEYFQRESEGTLKDILIRSSSSNSPLDIRITFSEGQPLLENQKYYMYINYYNKGKGYFDKETYSRNPDIIMNLPNTIQNLKCFVYDYKKVNCNEIKQKTLCKNPCSWNDICSSIMDLETCQNTEGCLWKRFPKNIRIDHLTGYCYGGICEGGVQNSLYLNKSLTFIRNKATPSTCEFNTSSVSTMDIKSLSLTATYKYVLDNSIPIVVKP